MTLREAIVARHSVRKYLHKPLSEEIVAALNEKIEECNREGHLHIQLVLNEPKAFKGVLCYGKFYGVENYLVLVGEKADDLSERAGYYGEKLVLYAQTLGLNTCWVGLSYHNVSSAYDMAPNERLTCMIALGYGENQGVDHKRKTVEAMGNVNANSPEWYRKGVEAAVLAPTAINQQKFTFEYVAPKEGEKPRVILRRGFSMVGYTQMDSGIGRLHFEIGAGKENFEWEIPEK